MENDLLTYYIIQKNKPILFPFIYASDSLTLMSESQNMWAAWSHHRLINRSVCIWIVWSGKRHPDGLSL